MVLTQFVHNLTLRITYYFFKAVSIAEITSFESGLVPGENRLTTLPSRPTRNFSKFHLIKATSEKFQLIDTIKMSKQQTWAHLAVSGNEIAVRELNGIALFDWNPIPIP